MTDLTIICSSRNRPQAAKYLFDSFMDTRETERVHLRFAMDDNDESYKHYPPGTRRYPSRSLTQAINLAAQDVKTTYIGSLCDEQRFLTPGWDTIVLDTLDEMGGGVVYPNDLINPGSMPACVFMSTAIVMAVGYFALPGLRYNYFDNVHKDFGEQLGRIKYLPEVYVQHLSMPQSFDNSKEIAMDRHDYFQWVQTRRAGDVSKAKTALGMTT